MNTIDTIIAGCFWTSLAGVGYAYAGYPVVIYGLSRLFGRNAQPPRIAEVDLPSVALLIVAHNEASVIESRIKNALALSYPRHRLQIVIASDGSDDATCEICRRWTGDVLTIEFTQRRGKAAALNDAVSRMTADVIVLSDANTFMDSDALMRLTSWFFADETVGAVSGRLVLTDPRTGRNVDSVYWRYETFLKQCEGRLGGLLGANGAIYAIRRSLFEPLRAGTIVDDFMVPLVARMRSGCRIVYDAHAVAHEETPADLSMEFRRRARIGVGGFQALATLWPLLSPRHGWTAFTFWSHKVMRWISPFLLVAMLLSSLLLISQPLFRIALVAQVAFYASCFVGTMLPPANRVARVLRIFGMFAAMNLALLTGFFRWLVSSQSGIWKRTERVPAAA